MNKGGGNNNPTGKRVIVKKFNDQAQERFIQFFAATGRFYDSAAVAGVSGQTVINEIKGNEAFALRYQEARGTYRDALNREAHRRAVEGVNRFIVQKGAVVRHPDTKELLTETVYSDNLLLELLKKHDPEFRPKQQLEVTHTGGVLLIPAGQTAEQWKEAQKGRVLDVEPMGIPAPGPTVQR